jgi:hypothetical protein
MEIFLSKTFNLVCDTCKVLAWVGEEINEHGSNPRPELMLYKNEAGFPARDFLYSHVGHSLRILDDEDLPDYEELSYP